jgi:uroporphyrinogen decarboxylase
MNRKENLMAAVEGKPTAYVPSGFWLHFPHDEAEGDAAVKAHVKFFKESETDIMKIMNENVVPYDVPIHKASDWKNLKHFTKDSPFIVQEIDLMKKIMDKTENPGVFLLTVHGIVASMWHARGGTEGYEEGRMLLADHLREDPVAFKHGLDVVTEALEILTDEALKAGIDGIYYAALGGERFLFTDEEFEKYIAPCDKAILAVAKSRPCFNVLHMCKDHLNLNRYKDYPCDVVNWSTFDHNLSIEDGKALFGKRAVLGGFDDRSGLLVDGTKEQIEAHAKDLVRRMGTTKFILGADCTLPTDIDRARIRTAVEAVM